MGNVFLSVIFEKCLGIFVCLLARRQVGRKTEYLVKWEGYPNEDCSWEPKANLHCPDKLAEFEEQQLLAALNVDVTSAGGSVTAAGG
jgi:hypothetical protein